MIVNKINKIILESDQRVEVTTFYFLGIPVLWSKSTKEFDSLEMFLVTKHFFLGILVKKSTIIRDIVKSKPKFSRFGHKWYIDYTFIPVMIPDDWDRLHFDLMKKKNLVFDSKEQAEKVAQKIKNLLGIQPIL